MRIYEAKARCKGLHNRIFNVDQTYYYAKSMMKVMPTLLTRTSTLWSQKLNRFLLPQEHLGALGLPIQGHLEPVAEHYLLHHALKANLLNSAQMRHAAGNGMVTPSIAAVILFVLRNSIKAQETSDGAG